MTLNKVPFGKVFEFSKDSQNVGSGVYLYVKVETESDTPMLLSLHKYRVFSYPESLDFESVCVHGNLTCVSGLQSEF